MSISATELNKHPGAYLAEATRHPVIIENRGIPTVVMLSYERYLELENAYWGEATVVADKERSIGKKQSLAFLKGND